MKILLYGINFSPELTGIGKYTGELAAWLAARGHDVRVVTAPWWPPPMRAPIWPPWCKPAACWCSPVMGFANTLQSAAMKMGVWDSRRQFRTC